MSAPAGRILLLAEDPDLAEAVPETERDAARRQLGVPQIKVRNGPWAARLSSDPPWGVLILSGLLARETAVAGASSTELLGPGDVLLAGETGADSLVPVRPTCTVLEPLHLALLDESLGRAVARWPALGATLLHRATRRAERLAVAQAIGHLTRVDARVLMMLWVLGERWGRVTSNGLLVALPLTHRTLARLVGARRPTVTTAVTDLSRRGLLARRDDGTWELHGAPPEELRDLKQTAAEPPPALAAPPPNRPMPPARHEPARRMAAQIAQLSAAYEERARRLAIEAERSRSAQERARLVREETARLRGRIHR